MKSDVLTYVFTNEIPFLDGGFIYLPLGTDFYKINISYARKSYGFNIQVKIEYDYNVTTCDLNIQNSDTSEYIIVFPYIYKDIALKWFSIIHKAIRM
jgi:hypothetical protein